MRFDLQLLIGKTPEEATTLLHSKGLHVALRYVDGELTYPVYTNPQGEPAPNTGRSVPKVRLDVEKGVVVSVEDLPQKG